MNKEGKLMNVNLNMFYNIPASSMQATPEMWNRWGEYMILSKCYYANMNPAASSEPA